MDDSSLADRGPRYALKRDETPRLFATFLENFNPDVGSATLRFLRSDAAGSCKDDTSVLRD